MDITHTGVNVCYREGRLTIYRNNENGKQSHVTQMFDSHWKPYYRVLLNGDVALNFDSGVMAHVKALNLIK